MVKIIEIKHSLEDGALLENLYNVSEIIYKMVTTLQNMDSLNIDDFSYANTVVSKCKKNLEKVYYLM